MSQNEGNSKELFMLDFNSPRTYNKLHISSCRVPEGQDVIPVGFNVPPKIQFEENKGTGDSHNKYQESEIHPYERQVDGLKVCEYNNCETLDTESNIKELQKPIFHDFRTTCDLNGMKIRYTRQYLLKCQRSPQAKIFPDCLLKYVNSDEVFLKKLDQEAPSYGWGRMDHILFYSSLPYTRKKPDPLGHYPWRKASV